MQPPINGYLFTFSLEEILVLTQTNLSGPLADLQTLEEPKRETQSTYKENSKGEKQVLIG
jgi:hypothetical protein